MRLCPFLKNSYLDQQNLPLKMALIKVPTSFNIDVEFEIPEFYKRMLALLIDMILKTLYFVFAIKMITIIGGSFDSYGEDGSYDMFAVQTIILLPLFIYHITLEILMNGQSIGKKLLGMRVVNENGGKPSISQYAIRWLLRLSDIGIIVLIAILASGAGLRGWANGIFILLALGFLVTDIILVASSEKGQRIGDMLARTILITVNSKASIEETIFREVEETYTPVFPQIMRLSDRDINAIKSILQSSTKKNDYAMATAAADKIKNHLQIQSDLDPQVFLDVLLKDYNYLSVK
jgi:uncharacterized RDD family membrane protein YckC